MAARHGYSEMVPSRMLTSVPYYKGVHCALFHSGVSIRSISARVGSKLNGTAVDSEVDSMPARPRISDACERGLPDVDACTIDFVRFTHAFLDMARLMFPYSRLPLPSLLQRYPTAICMHFTVRRWLYKQPCDGARCMS